MVVLLILLISCSRSQFIQQAELNLVSAHVEPQPVLASRSSVLPQVVINSNTEPETLANEIIHTPESFLAYFGTQEIDEAYKIVLTDEFVAELIVYQKEKFGNIYADEAPPLPVVRDILLFMERAVGGHYIFGGQGDVLTTKLLYSTNRLCPDYMNAGRLEYFLERTVPIGFEGIDIPPVYPTDFAWDCSGLWWDCVNTLDLFETYTDRTAMTTFEDYCTPITKEELRPGDLVFYRLPSGRISHMGIVGYDGYVYEAASGFVGVVKTQSLDVRIYEDLVRGGYLIFPLWNEFGRPTIYE